MGCDMQAGKLRHHVKIMRPYWGSEGFGLGETRWDLLRQCSASIEPRSGGERVSGEQVQQTTTHMIRVRRHPSRFVDSTCRIDYGDRSFEIRSVIDDGERGAELVMMCDEVTQPHGTT